MKLNNKKLYEFLSENGVTHLYHANSVSTSLSFIKKRGLLSRGAVEKRNLYQSYQSSDYKDKLFDIWDDIFLDTLDLHAHFGRQNYYGPVLFKVSTSFILNNAFDIWITRNNPIYWTRSMTSREKYFRSVRDFSLSWGNREKQKMMVTLRWVNKPVLFKYLNEIILDDPNLLVNNVDLYLSAKRALRQAINRSNLNIEIATRRCPAYCFCRDNYFKKVSERDLSKFFLPQ